MEEQEEVVLQNKQCQQCKHKCTALDGVVQTSAQFNAKFNAMIEEDNPQYCPDFIVNGLRFDHFPLTALEKSGIRWLWGTNTNDEAETDTGSAGGGA